MTGTGGGGTRKAGPFGSFTRAARRFRRFPPFGGWGGYLFGVVIGLLMVGAAVVNLVEILGLRDHGVRVTATAVSTREVTSTDSEGHTRTYYYTKVRFPDEQGNLQVGEVTGRYPPERKLSVVYLPEDPSVVRHDDGISWFAVVFQVGFIAAALCWLAGWMRMY